MCQLTDSAPDPTRAADLRDAVERLCAGLDEADRRLLELSAQGYRTTEIAAMLNQNADVLRVRLSRIRARLRTAGVADDWL